MYRIFCRVGIHNWVYSICNRKYVSKYLPKQLQGLIPNDGSVTLSCDIRKCSRCEIRQVAKIGNFWEKKWKLDNYTVQEKRDMLIKKILGNI